MKLIKPLWSMGLVWTLVAFAAAASAQVAGDQLQNEKAIVDDTASSVAIDPARFEAASAQSPFVRRANFTTAVLEREPVDRVDVLPSAAEQVFFFSEIVDREGHVITHRWLHDGETVAEIPIEIGGPRWRVYSSKSLLPALAGTWTVEIVDTGGAVLHTADIQYGSQPAGAR